MKRAIALVIIFILLTSANSFAEDRSKISKDDRPPKTSDSRKTGEKQEKAKDNTPGPGIDEKTGYPVSNPYSRKTVSYKIPYKVEVPSKYDQDQDRKYPLLVSLHGGGQRGSDITTIKAPNFARYEKNGYNFEFITISPLCPNGYQWMEFLPELNSIINDTVSKYRVDINRIYLTGTSMGGAGTWYLAAAYPKQFAAIMPVIACCDPALAVNLKDIPIWAMNGAKDPVVPLQYAQNTINALKAVGAKELKFTVDPEGGHTAPSFIKPEDTYN
ncbi:MAG: alpha/beta hydrolase-fold protein [Clostridia bacterium]|nr:alpha/beta hydrolase-fold protein [Clostridia bacterium]